MSSVLIYTCAAFSAGHDADDSEGVSAFNDGRYVEARDYFLTQLDVAATKNEALVYLGKISLGSGDNENALNYIEQALAIEPNTIEEVLLAGDIYCNYAQTLSMFSALKMAKKCIAHYDAAVKLDGGNISALIAAARFYLSAPSIAGGSAKKGNALLEQLSQLSPEDANTYKVHLLEADGNSSAALQLADELSKKGFNSALNQYEVAHYYRDKKHYDRAQVLFDGLLSAEVTPQNRWHLDDSLLQLGEIYIAKGEVKQGIELIEQYKARNNNVYDVHYFWSTWSLAKGYKALGEQEKYNALVNRIRSENYKKDTAFAKEFDARR